MTSMTTASRWYPPAHNLGAADGRQHSTDLPSRRPSNPINTPPCARAQQSEKPRVERIQNRSTPDHPDEQAPRQRGSQGANGP